ncbi:hypothetical protein N7447_002389 [Penicillium robsamsonii]|uniref:uncharacterized protein n=1 Tax=Penicillium robsamsonii TaxID=1792511 RepID=UPI0025476EF9|nr:uncharacterized protein N7447_002389 [Penicillium robsamsonii]KAJ5836363.1 hypothetical protein N7447_002389 [Penicillium robsamsonii]
MDVWDARNTTPYSNVEKIKVLYTSVCHYTPVTLINRPAADDNNSVTEQDGADKSPKKRGAPPADSIGQSRIKKSRVLPLPAAQHRMLGHAYSKRPWSSTPHSLQPATASTMPSAGHGS